MADDDSKAKLKNSSKGILKRSHNSSNLQEDDDNPIKSILKKSKKPKLDPPLENEQKTPVSSSKPNPRIDSQVTVVTGQKKSETKNIPEINTVT